MFEKTPDVGGVWSATRRYTGLRTQNNRNSYAFSDMPMPKNYPEWPTGEQVQAYLERYVTNFDLRSKMRLSTEVIRVTPIPEDGGWAVTSRRTGASVGAPERFDHLVIANGIFSEPDFPQYPGYADLVVADGLLVASSQFTDIESVRDKHVVVVGYGKSACDIATEVGPVAASTTVVARNLLWKMPKRIAGGLNFKYLLLTRLGENLFRYQTQDSAMERFLHGPGDRLRQGLVDLVGAVVARQLGLKKLGLLPEGGFEDIARSTVSLSTDGFYEQVADGTITVLRDTEITRLGATDSRPVAELSTGESIPADVVITGTGFHQRVPFLDEEIVKLLTDDRGNFQLWKQILPHDVPNLTFGGYNSSFFSPLSAEAAAWWIGAYLAGALDDLPPVEVRRAQVAARVQWMEERTDGNHARGTNVIPFSVHQIDETLADIGINASPAARLMQWFMPVNPSSYARVLPQLREKVAKVSDRV